jgi:hypothetical protein
VPGRSRALSAPSILAEKVGVADLGCPGFEILSGFVVLRDLERLTSLTISGAHPQGGR